MRIPLPALCAIVLAGLISRGSAHDEPTSFVDVRVSSAGMEVAVTASVTDVAHGMPTVDPAMLLDSKILEQRREEISAAIIARLALAADGAPVTLKPEGIVPVPEKRDLRVTWSCSWNSAPEQLKVGGPMFPYDPRHRTFVNVYSGSELVRQEILTSANRSAVFPTIRQQGRWAVFVEFVRQGIHHIFIGPDHILFIIGLLLLDGGLKQLLKIVTSFTVAHSITLGLATFRIITPPASLVEPVIALSIVLVGLHAFFGKGHRDPRMALAFGFGLIHGFGFASVLQEMVLPRGAMGLSLFAFNAGVEIAQASIVIAVAPVLLYLRRQGETVRGPVIAGGALAITAVGAFWFFQRVIG
jgi:hydrogenase/urease accessory protein HupE